MYANSIATNPDAFTPTQPEPTKPTGIGFRDTADRWWPMELSNSRLGAALKLGVDFVAVAKNPSALFAGTGSARALRVATAIAVVLGFDDDASSPGLTIHGQTFTPEQFARVLAEPKVFRAALEALTQLLAEYAAAHS